MEIARKKDFIINMYISKAIKVYRGRRNKRVYVQLSIAFVGSYGK